MGSVLALKPVSSFKSPGSHLCGLAWDGTNLWHSDGDADLLYRLESKTGRILGTLPCPEVRTGLAFDGARLWQVAGHPKRIRIMRLGDGELEQEISLGLKSESVCGLAVQGDSYWTGPENNGFVEQHSVATRTLLRQYGPMASSDGIALVRSVLWLASYKDQALIAIDLETGTEKRRYSLTGKPTGMCWDGRLFWYNDFSNKEISAVLPED